MKKHGEKFVVISGGAGGIGRAAASKLAELEYYPVLLDRDDAAGRKASAALAAAGFENEFHCAELANERQVGEAFAKILSQHKRVDALVNLAGGTFQKKPIQDLTLAEWQESLNANLKSPFLCCRAVIGVMKNRKAGNIINTSSNFGFSGNPFCGEVRGSGFHQVLGAGVSFPWDTGKLYRARTGSD